MTTENHSDCKCSENSRIHVLNTDRLARGLNPVKANIPQGMKLTTKVNIMRGRDIREQLKPKPSCKPRGNRQPRPWASGRIAVSEPVLGILEKSDKDVVDWLAKSAANRIKFFENPVASLVEAGVKLTRAEQKELSALVANSSAELVLEPNTTLNDITITASPTGKIGSFRPKGKPTSCMKKSDQDKPKNSKPKKGE